MMHKNGTLHIMSTTGIFYIDVIVIFNGFVQKEHVFIANKSLCS